MNEQPSRSEAEASPVEVRVAADLGQLSLLRALVETIALLRDFTLDEVADIRLAVDEVSSILILGSTPDAVLSCQFHVDPAQLLVRVSTVWSTEGAPDEDGFGWHVLRTLTDTITASQGSFEEKSSGYPTTIQFSRGRGIVDDG